MAPALLSPLLCIKPNCSTSSSLTPISALHHFYIKVNLDLISIILFQAFVITFMVIRCNTTVCCIMLIGFNYLFKTYYFRHISSRNSICLGPLQDYIILQNLLHNGIFLFFFLFLKIYFYSTRYHCPSVLKLSLVKNSLHNIYFKAGKRQMDIHEILHY